MGKFSFRIVCKNIIPFSLAKEKCEVYPSNATIHLKSICQTIMITVNHESTNPKDKNKEF